MKLTITIRNGKAYVVTHRYKLLVRYLDSIHWRVVGVFKTKKKAKKRAKVLMDGYTYKIEKVRYEN